MQYPNTERGDITNEESVAVLKKFRRDMEEWANEIEAIFGDHKESKDVLKSIIEARMWSGNLFGYYEIKDLNRERDKRDEPGYSNCE